ncbi:MAG: tRNA (adenosine(37)-N6)-threonylcarbamoyltransferase complex dimerization subunit type 1 TsaB [Phycisphaerae bacterium]|nr:tRNA (adenosine(37)-N6)-threonylcarbamoyltransferase complex dimerization subunit type 1 TsaB [Phycisphaerae bacterium]
MEPQPPVFPPQPPSDRAAWNLAIETSGRVGSVALGRGPDVLEVRTFTTTLRHAVELLPTIDETCRTHAVPGRSITQVYVSGGPGSFTGLRIGISFARGMALAAGSGMVRVPTLDVVAQNALDLPDPPPSVVVMLDAKRGNVFAAAFALHDGRYVAATSPAERRPDEFFASLPPRCAALGEGVAYHREAVARAKLHVLPEVLNRARAETVYRLGHDRAERGDFTEPAGMVPLYVRRPEAEEVWEKRRGAG